MKTLFRADIELFLIAVQFLTRIPIYRSLDYSGQKISEAASYYPAVGLCLGAFGAIVHYIMVFFFTGDGCFNFGAGVVGSDYRLFP